MFFDDKMYNYSLKFSRRWFCGKQQLIYQSISFANVAYCDNTTQRPASLFNADVHLVCHQLHICESAKSHSCRRALQSHCRSSVFKPCARYRRSGDTWLLGHERRHQGSRKGLIIRCFFATFLILLHIMITKGDRIAQNNIWKDKSLWITTAFAILLTTTGSGS